MIDTIRYFAQNKIIPKIYGEDIVFYRMYSTDLMFFIPYDSFQVLDEILFYFLPFKRLIYDPDRTIREGCRVFDLGAHVGLFTVLSSLLVGQKGRVVAVEPDPINYSLLKANVKVNQICNVQTIHAAVHHLRKSMKLRRTGWSVTGFLTENNDFASLEAKRGRAFHPLFSGESVLTPTLTMHDLLHRSNFSKLDFLKMDIEGSELSVLTRNNDWLTLVDIISGELHADRYGHKGVEKIIRALSEMGFKSEVRTIKVDTVDIFKKIAKQFLHQPMLISLFHTIYRAPMIPQRYFPFKIFYATMRA